MPGINIWASRRDCFERCKWWSRDESEDDLDEIVYNRQPTGIFYAKEYTPKQETNNVVGGVFMFDRESVTLRSPDDLHGIKTNDLVMYQNEKWIVESVQPRHLRNNATEFANEHAISHLWYISLRK